MCQKSPKQSYYCKRKPKRRVAIASRFLQTKTAETQAKTSRAYRPQLTTVLPHVASEFTSFVGERVSESRRRPSQPCSHGLASVTAKTPSLLRETFNRTLNLCSRKRTWRKVAPSVKRSTNRPAFNEESAYFENNQTRLV